VGETVGESVGDTVGLAVGESVGDTLGLAVGDTVGVTVGDTVGALVGAVGDTVGDTVGVAVGASVGDTVGESVGDKVGAAVGKIVGSRVGAVGALLGAGVGLVVGAGEGASVGKAVGLRVLNCTGIRCKSSMKLHLPLNLGHWHRVTVCEGGPAVGENVGSVPVGAFVGEKVMGALGSAPVSLTGAYCAVSTLVKVNWRHGLLHWPKAALHVGSASRNALSLAPSMSWSKV
jgi:hypothetical protein